jgi:hypothetical protein
MAAIADIPGTMTVSTITTLDEWAAHPLGKAARIGLLGLALTATSVRAASRPSVIRLTTIAAVMVSVLYVGQTS